MEAGSKPAVGPEGPTPDGVFRVLVVAAEEHVDEALNSHLDERASGQELEVKVVVPALAETAFEHAAGAVDEPREHAQDQLDQTMDRLDQAHVEAKGEVGDSDPVLAIEDALYGFQADEIVVVTHDAEHGRWLEDDLFDRTRKKFRLPVTHFVRDGAGVHEEGRSDAGADPVEDAEYDPESQNLPRFAIKDIAGIVIALIGTIVLFVIAGANPDETGSGFDTDALHLMLAGAALLVNLAHIVGLLLFESVGYRGPIERFFANFSLYGTMAAVAASLLLLLI